MAELDHSQHQLEKPLSQQPHRTHSANPYRPHKIYIQNKTTELLILHTIKTTIKAHNANPIQSTTQHTHCRHT
jgi:hypothetical protein